MKKVLTICIALLIFACQEKQQTQDNEQPRETTLNTDDFALFGEAFDINEKPISKEDLLAFYEDDDRTDTISVVFKSKILQVCQTKGCWMTLDLGNDDDNFVKFKDYGFFVPLNAAGSEAIIKGKAFCDVQTIDALKHHAEDAGKTQEEIDAINEEEFTYYFMADGVYINKAAN